MRPMVALEMVVELVKVLVLVIVMVRLGGEFKRETLHAGLRIRAGERMHMLYTPPLNCLLCTILKKALFHSAQDSRT